jgi:acid phosphatase type 7
MKSPIFVSLFSIAALAVSAQEILVRPYLQPGNASSLAKEQKVIVWETDSVPAKFSVNFHLKGNTDKSLKAKISHTVLTIKGKTTLLYRAILPGLKFDTVYHYEVLRGNVPITTTSFATRTKKSRTRFAVLGDFGAGTQQQAAIAYQIYSQKPQFVLTTGDNVYQDGLASEYRRNLFPVYGAEKNEPQKNVALMNNIPFYMVLGNHDVHGDSLDKHPDGLAYFYYSDLPLNAPVTTLACTASGSSKLVNAFKKNTKPRFPRMANFSFDYGNVHITCLDANYYANPLDQQLVEWMKEDIGRSKADWKLVAFHHPGFNSSQAHYDAQVMRLLSPVFEALKVDLVLTGHVHNYQRSVPLRFIPQKNETGDQYVVSPTGRVNGVFTLDNEFDGKTDTTPNGIIYIVTGAGGGGLYDMKISEKPELWKHEPQENWVPFTTKLISHLHSFTLIETNGKILQLKQIDLFGKEIDSISISK